MLATKCPMCGSDHNIVRVAPWPKPSEGRHFGTFKLAGENAEGEVCCSYDSFRFGTYEQAQYAAQHFGKDDIENLARERRDEALAVDDEHGYFMDYGPADSDYYD
jgi:hypothetical protein